MASIWEQNSTLPPFPALQGSIQTDVLIVGGGMAGLLCAHRLRHYGIDCVVVEADRIGGRVTKNTTAKITLQHGLLYDTMLRRYGSEMAAQYVTAQTRALQEYETLCRTIPCDYETQPAFVYSTTNRQKIEREVAALNRLGVAAEFSAAESLPFAVAGAVCVKEQAQFHPLKFLQGILRDITVYEHTKVTGWTPHRALTAQGDIRFKKAIIATHFPLLNKHGGYFLKMYQHRSYVVALAGAPPIDGMYVDEKLTGLSLRGYNGQLLLGGGGHRTGKSKGGPRVLSDLARRYYPDAHITARWAAQDCMTLDGIPYIGQYGRHTPDLYVATGFNKWGMSSSMVAAMLLSDALRDKTNDCAAVFSPSRSIWHPQLAINAGEALLGILTPTTPRCPHLGCALKYNRQEHSWDCTCHGSRFGEDGRLLDNPATDGLPHKP